MLSHITPKQRLLLCKPVCTGLNFKHTLLFYPAVLLFAKPITQTLYNGDVAKASASDIITQLMTPQMYA